MKKLLLSLTLTLIATINAWSQTADKTIGNKIHDSSMLQNLFPINLQENSTTLKNSSQLKMVPLSPDIIFDEFPVNHNMHIATDGTYYYTINGGNAGTGQVNKFDLTGLLIQTFPIQIDGRGLSYNRADGFLYASLYTGDIVRIDNLSTGSFTTIFTVIMQNGQASFAMSPDGTKFYDFYQGTLLVHDFFTGAVINTINGLSFGAGNYGGEAAVAVDSLHIYTWDSFIKTVYQYDLTGSLIQTLVLDSGDNGHSISRAGNYLFVSRDGNYAVGTWYGYLVDSTNNVSILNTCFGDSTIFAISNGGNLLGVQWDFGDPASGANNTAYILTPVHSFTVAGTYTVQVIKFYTTYTDTTMLSVTINSYPVINLGIDTSFCAGDSIQLNAGAGYTSYFWQDGSADSIYTASTAGIFYVTVSNNNCYVTDSIVLGVVLCNFPSVNFYSSDTSFCEKHCIDFTDLSTNNPTSWQWFFPGSDSLASTEQNPTGICYNTYGSFDVTLIACNANGCDTLILPGFINEYQTPVPVITQSNDTLFSSPGVSYQWWTVSGGIITGATNYYYVPTQGGDYYAIVTDTVGCAGTSNVITITGVKQISNFQFPISITPNPNNGSFIISLNTVVKEFSLRIVNSIGQTIYAKDWRGNKPLTKDESLTIDIDNAPSGLYAVELISGEKVYKQIFIKTQ